MNPLPKVVTLYSFKGGAGRTVCAANLAGMIVSQMAERARGPLLLLDLDLDSAGLTMMLGQYKIMLETESPWNTARLVSGDLDLGIVNVHDRFFAEGLVDVSIQVGMPPKSVLFLGAQVIAHDSADVKLTGLERLSDFLGYCKQAGIGTVVIDSASGRQDIARVCHHVSDVIVYCCRLTDQFMYGTQYQVDYFIKQALERQGAAPDIILLPMAVPKVTPQWKGRYDAAMLRLQTICSKHPKVRLFVDSGICEVESFKWQEEILSVKKRISDDQSSALGSFRRVAEKIVCLWVDSD